ncbi:hypothetical protein [Amycolatopsis sp. 195334CR]|uniref:hypothetical protein n=1 Tax=Amycolatopsis sp. 195334CR TaxID=2814588 RepID=UPI001A8F7242|nr:hypothetical protein [Amycolatopsis sp. 195334CR]MBN6035243.1 hypothetical protein [Amycolatopsis sp. 195334CR]
MSAHAYPRSTASGSHDDHLGTAHEVDETIFIGGGLDGVVTLIAEGGEQDG